MGTVFTVDIRDRGDWSKAIADVIDWLHHVDAVFSTYRPTSDVSRIRGGELRVADADPLVAEILDLCVQVQSETGGFFTAMPDGRLDPTGLVKGWAIETASRVLLGHGSRNHAVNGGGDIQLAGEASPGEPWRVGISDPRDPSRVVAVVPGRDLAIATSGVAERGKHIVNPFTGKPADDLLAVTVTGPSLTRVDAYATAAFAMGGGALRWVETQQGYGGLVITPEGVVLRTPSLPR